MVFKTRFADFKAEFDSHLSVFLESQVQKAGILNEEAAHFITEISHLVGAGGKRIRPALAYFGSLLNDTPASKEAVYQIGFALELFHTFALIHDDIIDKATMRRNIPTLETVFREYFSKAVPDIKKVQHFSLSAAILGGDFAHTIADQIIAGLEVDSSLKEQLLKLYFEMQFELVSGQIDDCFGVGMDNLYHLSEGKILNMIKLKSGNYSIQKPLMIGAVLAGIDQERLQILATIGEKLGLVFQIQDDILGIFGKEMEVGKSVLSDIVDGKRTMLVALTINRLEEQEDKAKFISLLGDPTITLEDVSWVKQKIEYTGALDMMKARCKSLVDESNSLLHKHFQPTEGRDFIFHLSDYLLHRIS